MESSWRTVDPMKDMSNLDLTTSEVKKGDLTTAMDIFSAGSVSPMFCILCLSSFIVSVCL